MATNAPIRKSKKATAAIVHEEFRISAANSSSGTVPTNSGPSKSLNELLHSLLDPRKPISDLDTIDWIKWLMAGGRTPEEFFATVRLYDNATTCGLVWTADFVAYRCRTCGISPCMSLCANCFQQGNHEGHDFNMFRSQAGGACDCGDTNVMKESGFCHNHGPKAQLDKPSAPEDLLCITESILPRLLLRLVRHLRERSTPINDMEAQKNFQKAITDADPFLTMLHNLSQLGAAMRFVMTRVLTDPQVYMRMTEESSDDPDVNIHLSESNEKYKESLSFLRTPASFEEHDYPALQNSLYHRTFLDEFVFWTVMFKFPQKLVCFLLNMLPDNSYKEAFTRAFVQHYSRISVMLVNSVDSDLLSNRVVHVSVQLFSNEALALQMAKEMNLLHLMILSLTAMINQILIPSTLHDVSKNFDLVVDCNKPVMNHHCYWSLVSDLNNVLSHKPLVMMFVADSTLLSMWFNFLNMFQGMNVNQRELSQHVKFEPNTYYAAFSAELEASASILWAVVSHLRDWSTLHLTKNVLKHCLDELMDWFDSMGFPNTDLFDPYQVSFHLPLHRCYAVFLSQAVKHQGANLTEILPSVEDLQHLLIHPLKAQVAFYEILCGMWVRNGLQMKGQAMTYIQCHFCNSMVDADLFLLQVISTQVDPDWFIMSVLERFHVIEWMSFDSNHSNTFLEPEHEMPMLEGALMFLAMLFSLRTNIGHQDGELTKMEMVSLLCMADRTHSQLTDLMPEKCGSVLQNKDFEATLARVADYKGPNFEAGGNMLQGTYVPKAEVWEHDYDPIYVLLRAINRRDFQASIDRFAEFARQTDKLKDAKVPWAPFRIPGPVHPGFSDPRKLLHCKTMHSVLFTILYKSVHDPTVSEMSMSLCIYLLDMAVRYPVSETLSGKELLLLSNDYVDNEVHDLELKDWFNSSFIFTNLQHTISKVILPSDGCDSEGMEVDNYTDLNLVEMTSMDSPTYALAVTEEIENMDGQRALPGMQVPLSLPAAETSQALVPVLSGSQMIVAQQDTLGSPTPSTEMMAITDSTMMSSSSFLPSSPTLPPSSPPQMALSLPESSEYNKSALILHRKPNQLKLIRPIQDGGGGSCSSSSESESNPSSDLKALPPSSSRNDYVVVNESMLTLLLKLHSKLSCKPNSYVPLHERLGSSSESVSELRIGNGPHFIALVLDKICQLSIRNARLVQDIRNNLWPTQPCSSTSQTKATKDASDKEERRRRARERQEKLMAEFASRQKAFMETSEDTTINEDDIFENDSTASPSNDESVYSYSKKYNCAICGQTSPSSENKPVGLVCLLQASSVLGHSLRNVDGFVLPCSEEERSKLRSVEKRAAFMDRRIDELGRNFSDISRLMAVNIGYEGGIHIWTCGHHLHLDCHKSYIQSLKNQQSQHTHRQQSLAVDKGEYSCPLCRQLANTVLPITSDVGEIAAVVKSHPSNQMTLASDLLNLINSDPPTPQKTSNLMKAMGSIMEDMANATYPKYKFCTSSQCAESLFLFISSVARTNLELEIIQKGGILGTESVGDPTSRPCFMPLLHVLGMHSKMLNVRPHSQLWPQITGLNMDSGLSSVSLCEKEVPLLLRDMTALLLQLVLTLPMHIDRAYFSCIARMLYNVVYMQAVATLTCRMSEEHRLYWKAQGKEAKTKEPQSSLISLVTVIGEVVDTLEHCVLYLQDDDMDKETRTKRWTLSEMESELRRMCLPFLRITTLLRQHIYKEELPTFDNRTQEFDRLVEFVGLKDDVTKPISSASCLTWITSEPVTVMRGWCNDFIAFVNTAQIAARNLLDQHVSWVQPRLLRLPRNYDRIFQHYHQRPCLCCNRIPKDPSICLLCGRMVCFKEKCCWQQHSVGEAITHSIDCGAGTAMFLAVNSSIIIVIRGKRACLWGSVYLDGYGEEDRDLKRGKPLFLSEERYRLLERQWLTHSFDHTNKRWIWHKDTL